VRRRWRILAGLGALLAGVGLCAQQPKRPLDPAAWGGNHVGKPMPELVHGDECLFCHRNDIGPSWQRNAHGLAMRQREDAPELAALLEGETALGAVAPEVRFFLGSRHRVRMLKKSGYGRMALLTTQAVLGPGRKLERWIALTNPGWDPTAFPDRCVGCHASGVDSKAKTFSSFGHDCYACHGSVPLDHSNDTSLVWLSKKRRREAPAVTSLCAQCHVRQGGRSRSTGLAYPNNFVAGDNLFQDYEVDFARADDSALNAGDRHVLQSVRDVALHGSEVTCLSCHHVHPGTSTKHRLVVKGPVCLQCHEAEGPMKAVKRYTVSSPLCQY
jgi:hypothetical protein